MQAEPGSAWGDRRRCGGEGGALADRDDKVRMREQGEISHRRQARRTRVEWVARLEAQMEVAWDNLEAVLAEAGMTVHDLVKTGDKMWMLDADVRRQPIQLLQFWPAENF